MATDSRTLKPGDWAFLSPADAARQVERPTAAIWTIHLMLAAFVAALGWAMIARVDVVARAEARVIPEGRVQQIASLEGGLLRELKVREGEEVVAGQVLAMLDPTRIEAQQNEGRARLLALAATVARLEGESQGREPVFGPELAPVPGIVQAEQATHAARMRSLQDADDTQRRSAALLQRELSVAEQMAARGLMSDVEVMRLKRQLNELTMQSQDRRNRLRQEAAAELVKARTELAALRQQAVVRQDILERTHLTSPVRGIVKNIRQNTLGGVVTAGGVVMEVVPLGDTVLMEARIKPGDIGMVRVGQKVAVRLAAYDASLHGFLDARVETIAPDSVGEGEKQGAEATFTRALVRADAAGLVSNGKVLPVRPGMVGTADIRVGRRTVMQFLLKPLARANEAFTER